MTPGAAPTSLAPLLQRFFTQRLMQERRVSPHTIGSYRDSFRLLLTFTQQRLHKPPAALVVEDLEAPLIVAFLDHLEQHRGLSVRSRNLRLTALHSFFRYLAFELPTRAAQIQRVLAIPSKRYTRTLVRFLTRAEVDALLAAPDRRPWFGRRDHAFILMAAQTGLRLSEITGATRDDLVLGPGGARAGDRQGPEGALHAVGETNGGGAHGLVAGARQGRWPAALCQRQGRAPECAWGAVPPP